MSRNKEPFDLWREWIDKAERQLNTTLNDLSETAPYNQVSGKMVQAMMGMQTSFNEATQRYFSTLNLPSRQDIISLADRLEAIERRLVSIETALRAQDEGSAPSTDRPKPRRTKKASSRPPVAAPPKPKTKAAKKKTAKKAAKKATAKKVTKKKTTKKKAKTASKKKAAKRSTRKASRKKA